MAAHLFDYWGWYAGGAADGAPRSTPIAPANTSTSATPGASRANWTGHEWVDLPYATPASPADVHQAVRAELWERIKAERDRRKFAGFQVGAHWFHSDPDSRTQQLMLYAKAVSGRQVPVVPWKTHGGAFVPMTAELAEDIGDAATAHDIALFTHAEALRMAVDAAENPSSVDITAGWPPVFGEV